MEKFNVVVVLCNGELFGVWSFPADNEPSESKKNDLKHAVKEKLKALGTEDVFTVEFTDTYVTDYFPDVADGILDTIENHY